MRQNPGQKHAAEKQALERANTALGNRVHEGQVETATLKERLKAADERAKGLEHTLAAALGSQHKVKSRPAKQPRSSRPA